MQQSRASGAVNLLRYGRFCGIPMGSEEDPREVPGVGGIAQGSLSLTGVRFVGLAGFCCQRQNVQKQEEVRQIIQGSSTHAQNRFF